MALEPSTVQCIPARCESRGDGDFAAGFDKAGGSAEAHLMETWIAHSMAVAADIVIAFASFV